MRSNISALDRSNTVGKKVFLLSVAGLILFLCFTIISALSDIHTGLSWVKESFEWMTTYGLPWVIVFLLYLILKKLGRK